MEKKTTVEVKRLVKEVVTREIICNKCGDGIIVDQNNKGYNFEQDLYHEFNLSFGYGSAYDMESWSFNLCELCLEDIVRSFVHVPSGFQLDQQYFIVENESEEHQKLFDEWKDTGEWDELKFKSYEELIRLKDIYKEGFIDSIIKERYPNKQT